MFFKRKKHHKCQTCSNSIREQDNFCSNCGTSLKKQKSKKNKLKSFITTIIIILIVYFGIRYFSDLPLIPSSLRDVFLRG